jgi:DNA polymerase III delta subunit
MHFIDFKKQIDENNLFNFYILTGEEQGLINLYLNKLDYIKADSFQSIVSKLSSGLFKTDSKIYVIRRDKEILKKDFEKVKKIIKNDTVILVYGQIDGRKKFFKNAKLYTVKFDKLDSPDLVSLVKKDIEVSDELALYIIRKCGRDVQKIINECGKLKYVESDITQEVVDEVVSNNLEYQVFDLMNSLLSKKADKVFTYYELLKDENTLKIINLLYGSIKKAFLVKSYVQLSNNEISDNTGLTSGQVYMIKKHNINGLTLIEMLNSLEHLFEMDYKTKYGQITPQFYLQNFLVNVLKK